jgi:hypothetical protein
METIVFAITLEDVDEDAFQELLLKTRIAETLNEFSDDYPNQDVHWKVRTVGYDEAHVGIFDARTVPMVSVS